MAAYTFIKDSEGWYVDLKKSPFNRKQKGMVRGADTLLGIIANEKRVVMVDVSTSVVRGYEHLDRKKILNLGTGGADYVIHKYKGKKN